MAGHSKWANIKHRKGAADKKRAKIFTKLIKEIQVASKEGGPEPDNNPRLRSAITNAKAANMPKDNIERAIKKGSGNDGEDYIELTYEGYGPHGVAIMVECTTDNQNRTVAAVRSYFTKHNGSLGVNGSVDYMFDRKGVFIIPKGHLNEDDFTLEVIDAGAEDVEFDGDFISVTTDFESFGAMQKKLDQMGMEPESANLERIPQTYISLDVESAQKVMKLIDMFEDDDDVAKVFHNLELNEEILESL